MFLSPLNVMSLITSPLSLLSLCFLRTSCNIILKYRKANSTWLLSGGLSQSNSVLIYLVPLNKLHFESSQQTTLEIVFVYKIKMNSFMRIVDGHETSRRVVLSSVLSVFTSDWAKVPKKTQSKLTQKRSQKTYLKAPTLNFDPYTDNKSL
jgi:hypothetical protein